MGINAEQTSTGSSMRTALPEPHEISARMDEDHVLRAPCSETNVATNLHKENLLQGSF